MIKDDFRPNGVLFKLDDGSPCIVKLNGLLWDWERVFKMDVDYWQDLNAVDPFEFVFVYFGKETITTDHSKSVIPDASFLSLYEAGSLAGIIEDDYNRRYNK